MVKQLLHPIAFLRITFMVQVAIHYLRNFFISLNITAMIRVNFYD